MRNVLIIEDHPIVAGAAQLMITSLDPAIATVICANAKDAIAQIDGSGIDWDLIFLDLQIPGAIGLSLAREIQKRGLATRCCVVTAHYLPEYVDAIKSWSFLGYVGKSLHSEAFKEAMRKVLCGIPSYPANSAIHGRQSIRLPRRQIQILELIRDGRSSRQIGGELHLTEGTINNQVAAILQSLRASTRTQALMRAIEFGLVEAHSRLNSAD